MKDFVLPTSTRVMLWSAGVLVIGGTIALVATAPTRISDLEVTQQIQTPSIFDDGTGTTIVSSDLVVGTGFTTFTNTLKSLVGAELQLTAQLAPIRMRTNTVIGVPGTELRDLEVSQNAIVDGEIELASTGPSIGKVAADPNGSVTEPKGSLLLRTDTATLYQNTDGATAWSAFGNTSGQVIGYQVLTGASGTYTPTTGTKKVLLRMTGAGGGGGGAQAGALGSATFGGGGGSGTFLQKWIDCAGVCTGGAWTGAVSGGAGGTGNAVGTTGTDAVITINATVYTAKGGIGGGGMASSGNPDFTAYGYTATNTSGPADFIAAEAGIPGARYANSIGVAGKGGSNPFGYGGASLYPGSGAPVNGSNAFGYGGGGGGAVAWDTGTGNKTGGTGTGTLIIVQEFN
jgi:hypothetical protein